MRLKTVGGIILGALSFGLAGLAVRHTPFWDMIRGGAPFWAVYLFAATLIWTILLLIELALRMMGADE